MGMDRTIAEQYLIWLGKAVSGDLGTSVITGRPVLQDLLLRMPVTLELGVLGFLIAMAVSIPLGVKSAMRPGGVTDFITTLASLLGLAIPNFLLATLLVYVFSLRLAWFPSIGYTPLTENFRESLYKMVLPAIAVSAYMIATVTRMTRTTVLDVLYSDYVRTARAKGLSELKTVTMHGLRAALAPVITMSGIEFAKLLGGTLIIEQIFALPGFGRYAVEGIFARDYVVVQGTVLVTALIFVVVNLVVDIFYALADPRVEIG
jgi:peptide/nickel transport system permease protein